MPTAPAALTALLDRLDAAAARKPAPGLLPDVISRDGGKHGYHVVFGCIIHGDEVGSLPAAARLLDGLDAGTISYGGRVSVLLGNRPAALAGVRFLEEDLNRVFLPGPARSAEHRRALALMPLLDAADLFLDLHQTIEPTRSAFAIFPWDAAGEAWVRALDAAPAWVTRPPGLAFSAGSRCGDEHVLARNPPGITVELSQKGFSDDAEALAFRLMVRALQLADVLAGGAATLEELAANRPLPTCYVPAHAVPFDDAAMALRPGLQNLAPVTAGELLSAPASPPITSPCDGVLLFPKYPPRGPDGRAVGPLPAELVRILAPLHAQPAALWGGAAPATGATPPSA